jgi:hypothetical protein
VATLHDKKERVFARTRSDLSSVSNNSLNEIVKGSSSSDPQRAFGPNANAMLQEHQRVLEKELQVMNQDGVDRVYIDYFEDRENTGIKYKG